MCYLLCHSVIVQQAKCAIRQYVDLFQCCEIRVEVMRGDICIYSLLFVLLLCINLCGISIVYNFRIAQITKQPITEKPGDKNGTVIALLFEQYGKKYNGVQQNFAGGFGSYIYDFSPYYFRIDGAVSHIHEKTDHITSFSGTEADDILFTLGRNAAINQYTSLTFSGLFGIPTHRLYRLQHVDFGYSQVGTGLQLDGVYSHNHINDVIYGARYIYFAPRQAFDSNGQWHRFTLGNVADVLIASNNRLNNHRIEFGYTARFSFGACAYPNFDDIAEKTNYIRSNLYLVYKYKFSIRDIPNRFLCNISYGRDHVPRTYGNKYIITLWASWNVNF